MLALVAIASRARHGPGGSGRARPSEAFFDYALSTYIVVSAFVFVAVVVLLVGGRDSWQSRDHGSVLRQLLAFALVMGVVALLINRDAFPWLRHEVGAGHRQQPAGKPRAGKRANRLPRNGYEPSWRWAPAIVLGVLAVGGAATFLVLRRRRAAELDDDAAVAEALAAVLDDAVADLRAERDARRAIVAAYARMEALLAAYRLPRRPFEAPFEYLGRVLVDPRASAKAVFELTALFERAKFSHHRMDAELKEEAIDALVAVRESLARAA